MKTCNLNQYYQVNVNHLLSTRLDAEISKEFFEKIVFHGTAYNALSTLVSSTSSTFTVTGSYGTGKSTLAAILTGYVHPDRMVRSAVKKLINDSVLEKKLEGVFSTKEIDTKPWLVIKAVAGVVEPIELLRKSIINAVEVAGLLTCVKGEIDKDIKNEDQLLNFIISIFNNLKGKISGTLFILDEMGKLLETFARNSGNLHFFQDLAEKIKQLSKQECPFVFMGILHQSFADYAKGLNHQIALEWAKIQGRYIDISYRISLDESIALISKTIKRTELVLPDVVEEKNQELINKVQEFIGSRLLEHSPKVKEYFYNALPLHPLTSVLLGAVAKSSFSQNERSIFSFLMSAEPYSLRKFFDANISLEQKYSIVDLWDYLSHNLQHQILSSKEGHDWGIVEQSLTLVSKKLNEEDKTIAQAQLCFNLIKSIAMMNIFGKSLGVYPTRDLLKYSFYCNDKQGELIDKYLDILEEWKIIRFLNTTNSYVVVNSSSINIQDLVNSKLKNLSENQSYLELTNYKENIVLAKRHYQEKGIMRWMGKFLIHSLTNLNTIENNGVNKAVANFILLAKESLSEKEIQGLSTKFPKYILAKTYSYKEIDTWARELFVLQQIKKDQTMLMFDSASNKEFEVRYNHVYKQLDKIFNKSFDSVNWYYLGKKYQNKQLSVIASDIADEMFSQCPKIFNELVVRNEISSSAASGRKKLLEKMLENPELENLGIEKFPAEKAIYLSCLKRLGMHELNTEKNKWEFVIPKADKNENHKLVKELLETGFDTIKNNKQLISIEDLYKKARWASEPFGLPQGILPIFAMALLQAKKDHLAFYDKDVTQEYCFISDMDEEFINKLIKRPHEVAVKYVKTSSEKEDFLLTLSGSIKEIYGKTIEPQPLQVARFIVSSTMKRSKWIKNSRDIEFFSSSTQKLRTTILKADDPYKLLFEDMYDILQADTLTPIQLKAEISNLFLELDNAKPELLNRFENLLKAELGEFDTQLLAQAEVISKSAADWKLQKFAFHLTKSQESSKQWISNLITLLSQMPERDWSDSTLRRAFEELPSYAQRFKQLSYFVKNSQCNETNSQKHLAIIVNTPDGFEEYNRDVRITDQTKTEVESAMELFKVHLEQMSLNKDTKAMVLYELLKQYLSPVQLEGNEEHV
ncbi:hypothetical protein [Acinetobacter sp. YH01025]|uniref:hypothetical protein n=1 Tax=Acinetobacter sp. YH01025 TaxID=2601038 RepID=UPI0015D0E831|nr:hypothetical protein [Acinetobacter sp. YH01025]